MAMPGCIYTNSATAKKVTIKFSTFLFSQILEILVRINKMNLTLIMTVIYNIKD